MADSGAFANFSRFFEGKLNTYEYFWKSEWHNDWFPLPRRLNDLLNKAPNSPVMFGIYLHENPQGVYGTKYYRYLLDPTELVIWKEDKYSRKGARANILHELKAIDGSGKERQGDRNAIDASNCKYDFNTVLNLKHLYRPSQLPKDPITPEEPVPADLNSVYFYNDFGKWIPYCPKLQQALNSGEEILTFGIYQRNWPELFGGGFNQYFIDPYEGMQISASWKKTRSLAKIKTARDLDSGASDAKIEMSMIDATKFPISFKLPEHYTKAKNCGVLHQSDLDDKRIWDLVYNLDVVFWTVIACKLRASQLMFQTRYVAARNDHFTKYTIKRNLTGMILSTPDWPAEFVLFYFEGPIKEIQNLDELFAKDGDLHVSNTGWKDGPVAPIVGQGFLEDRMFGEWQQNGTFDDTKEIFDLYSKQQGHTIADHLARVQGFYELRNVEQESRKLRERRILAPKVHQVSI